MVAVAGDRVDAAEFVLSLDQRGAHTRQAVAALADVGALFERPEWVAAARAAAQLLVDVHLTSLRPVDPLVPGPPSTNGHPRNPGTADPQPTDPPRRVRLARTSRDGVVGTAPGVLEDYADVAEGFLALYQATSESVWVQRAGLLLDSVLARFGDGDGGFFDTADDSTDAVLARLHRPRDIGDGPTPAGQAAAAGALVTYAAPTGSALHRDAAECALTEPLLVATRYPRAAGWALAVAEAVLDGPREVAVVGPVDDPRTVALRRVAIRATAPGAVLAVGDPAHRQPAPPHPDTPPPPSSGGRSAPSAGFSPELGSRPSLARQLDADLDVVLVEPKDAFVHASAALRAVVDPAWQNRVFYPYDRLPARGRVEQSWARRVSPRSVRLSPFETIDTDYLVLATGTVYPFPARFIENETEVAATRLTRLREALGRTDHVLLVGGGPVGLELAGELTSAFARLHVTVVDIANDVLTAWDYLPELRTTIRDQLTDRGVTFLTGAPLAYRPPVDVGVYAPFTVETAAHVRIDAQMWFQCHGARPVTDYLGEELAASRRPHGHIRVTEHLTVVGQERVFAIWDITDIPEPKRASAAVDHAAVAAQNIRDLVDGRRPSARYTPGPEFLVLPLGPDGGAAQVVREGGRRAVVGPEETSRMKGIDLFSTTITELFGRPTRDAQVPTQYSPTR